MDIDEQALAAARLRLGTVTIKDTVNRALRRAAGPDRELVRAALDTLAERAFPDRQDAWR